MSKHRESDRAQAPTIVLMIAVLACVVCLVANAVSEAPLEIAVTDDPPEVPSSQPIASVAVLRDTVDADVTTSRADLAVDRSASDAGAQVTR